MASRLYCANYGLLRGGGGGKSNIFRLFRNKFGAASFGHHGLRSRIEGGEDHALIEVFRRMMRVDSPMIVGGRNREHKTGASDPASVIPCP